MTFKHIGSDIKLRDKIECPKQCCQPYRVNVILEVVPTDPHPHRSVVEEPYEPNCHAVIAFAKGMLWAFFFFLRVRIQSPTPAPATPMGTRITCPNDSISYAIRACWSTSPSGRGSKRARPPSTQTISSTVLRITCRAQIAARYLNSYSPLSTSAATSPELSLEIPVSLPLCYPLSLSPPPPCRIRNTPIRNAVNSFVGLALYPTPSLHGTAFSPCEAPRRAQGYGGGYSRLLRFGGPGASVGGETVWFMRGNA